jgi:L-threonylcarbamoyladenylate synthase
MPGPVTLVVANPERRYPLACREDPERLGLRLIEGPLSGAACPLFQTSANRSGEPPVDRPAALARDLQNQLDIVDGGVRSGEPSAILDLTGTELRFIREGDPFFTQKGWKTLRKSL